jgi:hypothetical protein
VQDLERLTSFLTENVAVSRVVLAAMIAGTYCVLLYSPDYFLEPIKPFEHHSFLSEPHCPHRFAGRKHSEIKAARRGNNAGFEFSPFTDGSFGENH